MKISKLALIALLGGALMAFGCSDDTVDGGGSGGTGGTGGTAGEGGGGGTGPTRASRSQQAAPTATSIATDENCEPALATPPTADVCDGTESLGESRRVCDRPEPRSLTSSPSSRSSPTATSAMTSTAARALAACTAALHQAKASTAWTTRLLAWLRRS